MHELAVSIMDAALLEYLQRKYNLALVTRDGDYVADQVAYKLDAYAQRWRDSHPTPDI